MSDPADSAEVATELFLRAAIAARQDEGPKFCGMCYNCGEALDDPHRFCDNDCRDDWQRRTKNAL
jgi:hypothetical protein